ncbi:uncharacterized protein LOC117525409 [Thalassophryne amazonica]|uniref:uncharacterized protein LOC117525409 n=1 Tax=Thalassophryne amazonica TaxID=390379 RepID=UPI0014717962|nr:uncharacterized protein LOC117525409 [Thalassophryne amazonica]
MSDFLTESCEEIINVMHQDDIARHIRNDALICKYGNALSTKYDHDKSQFAYIAQKMRELGRFILAVNELDKTVQYLHEICLPSRFELAVEGAKKLSGFDPSSTKFKTFSLVPKIHYSLKRAAEIAFGESRMTENSETEGQVKQFIQLLDTKWNGCFSHKALASSAQKQDFKKVEMDTSTVTEDLIKLYKYIKHEGDEARKALKENPSLSPWKKLSEATLADVCLFNRRRIGNIGRLLLQTYTSRNNRKALVPSADQMRKSTKLELDLGDKFTKLELEGQYGRNMLILLTERMMSSIDMLVENRDQAGVSKNNPYLFARAEGPSFVRALDCFRRAAVECGVKNPETLLSPSLRDRIACCWQLMSLGEQELDQVAMQMGRSSEDYNRLCENASQLEEVSRQLLKMDRKMPLSPPATVRDGTVPKAPTKRKPWSEKEQAAVQRYLGNFITMMKVPGKKDCNACIAAEPDLLGRSWTDVKSYVHNTVQTIRRKSNQQRCEVTQTTKKDLADTLAVGGMATVRPSELRESPNCCNMTIASPTDLTKSVTSAVAPFPQDVTSGYVSMSSAGTSVLHGSQPLISSFTPLNATDIQVVPTFTPHNTTNSSLVSPVYTSENISFPPLSPVYTQQNTTRMPLPPVYTQQDITSSSMISTFTPLNAPSTQMAPRFTQLNSQSTPVVPGFSPLFAESRPIISSFTPLNHSSPPAYPTSPPGPSATSQVVPSIHALNVPDRASVVQEGTPIPLARKEVTQSVKPQKRTKRLWSEEEQSAVRRHLGDFCKLVKVPGKKDCDACLAAEPALSTRTWREVKYFVHNSIQSMKRRNALSAPQPHEEKEHETTSSNMEWDGPVYLSL